MKPYFYSKLFSLLLLLTLCVPALCTPAKSKRADTGTAQASQSKQEKKQILRYYIRVCRLTDKINVVQRTENNLLQHPSYWGSLWPQKMRSQVAYVHTLREAAKSLKPPPICQPANQDLVASLTLLETAFLKVYQSQMAFNQSRDVKGKALSKEEEEASAKSKAFQYKFLGAMRVIQKRYQMPINRYNVTDWPTAAM